MEKENIKNEIRGALEQLLANANVVNMEANERLEIAGNITVQLPLTLEGARATITRLREMARANDIDFNEFEGYSAQIEAAVRDQLKDNITMEPNEAGVSEYDPAKLDIEKDKSNLEI